MLFELDFSVKLRKIIKINQRSNIENLDFSYYLDFGFKGLSSQIESCSIILYASFKVVEVVLN